MIFNKDKSGSNIFYIASRLLGREVPLQIIFPENHFANNFPSPVLYLLHGLFGRFDNWTSNTEIYRYAKDCGFVIVCIEGGDNWYVDSRHIENHFYESYILEELIPAAEKKFNFGQSRAKRAVAGLSMGGYGAFKFAFRRPEMFGFAASMSGAFHATEIRPNQGWEELQSSIQAVFADDFMLRSDNDLFKIIEKLPDEKTSELPDLYFDCGSADSFLPINRKLSELLKNHRIFHEFNIFPGKHDWTYWNSRLLFLLRKFLKNSSRISRISAEKLLIKKNRQV